jgi:hypothetical protein
MELRRLGYGQLQRLDAGRKRRQQPHLLALMHWIRSPWWDGIWILTACRSVAWLFSRLFTSRSKCSFKPLKFIGLPLLLLALAAVVGSVSAVLPLDAVLDISKISVRSPVDFQNPLIVLMLIYAAWNAYHFGMQNFGVLRIYQAKCGGGQRSWDMTFCLVTIAVATLLPFVPRLPFAQYLYLPTQMGYHRCGSRQHPHHAVA